MGNWYKTAAATEKVMLRGALHRTRDGYHYVHVPGTIISAFLALLPPGVMHPADRWEKHVGAHISVLDAEECPEGGLDEVGEEFEYRISGLGSVETPKGDTVYLLEVESPALERLRERYGLTPLMKGDHEFHITVGVKR